MGRKLTDEEIVTRYKEKQPNIEILSIPQHLEEYGQCQCLICGAIFKRTRHEITRGNSGCPVCSRRRVYEGITDIKTTHPYIVPYFSNQEEATKYSYTSKSKTKFKCPECGFEEERIISEICKRGFKCRKCGDGISLPNKIIRNLILQLPVENVIIEYNPEWSNNKRYDIYFEYQNKPYIVEMNGEQHYKDTSWSTLDYQTQNDNYKTKLAQEHNINIIHINAEKSEFKVIKNNILNSPLGEIFDFSNIDWNEIFKKSLKSKVVEICSFYKEHPKMSTGDIGKIFDIDPSNIRDYLYRGTECGLCYYNPKETKYDGRTYLYPYGFDMIPVKVYNKMGEHLGDYENLKAAAEDLSQRFNIDFYLGSIESLFRRHGDDVLYKNYFNIKKQNPNDFGRKNPNASPNTCIPINVYDINNNLLGEYKNVPEAVADLNNRFEVKTNALGIRKALRTRGNRVEYKHFYIIEKRF